MQLRSRMAALALSGAAGAALLTGCGNSAPAQTYAPMAAYGQGGDCYYAQNPAEVGQLKAAGLCQQNWFPRQAPQSWLDEYYYYYDSPLYYDTYVPARYRTAYVKTYMPQYRKSNLSGISTLSKKATYYSTSGARVPNVTSTARFGSGSSFGKAGHSTGSLRVGSTSRAKVTTGVKGTANIPGTSGYKPAKKSTKSFTGGSLRKSTRSGRH